METSLNDRDVCIMGIARTPIGNFLGQLSGYTAVELGSFVIKNAISRAGIQATDVEEVFIGNVISSNCGQAPARQAALKSGIPSFVPCTTINKVCASGMKATIFGAQTIQLNQRDIVVVGGMESMSKIPHYVPSSRTGTKMGPLTLVDGMEKDGLMDAYENKPMGDFAERCSFEYNIKREEQDKYTERSYTNTIQATISHKFDKEIVPLTAKFISKNVITKNNSVDMMIQDEEPFVRTITMESLSKLNTVFTLKKHESVEKDEKSHHLIKEEKGEYITAGNASPISDGAAAMVLMSRKKAKELGLTNLIVAIIRSYADVAQEPEKFVTSPSIAISEAIQKANISTDVIDYYEINEAFAVVPLVNAKLLNIKLEKINIYGGAVAMGHPLGCSGARIIVTLCSVLLQEFNAVYGCAAICNGGGGGSAIIIQRIS